MDREVEVEYGELYRRCMHMQAADKGSLRKDHNGSDSCKSSEETKRESRIWKEKEERRSDKLEDKCHGPRGKIRVMAKALA